MVAVSDFSGLTSCACAFARAAARAATDSLDCCTAGVRIEHIKADSTGFRALCPHPMPDRLPCVFWNEVLELAFSPLMLEKCRARVAEHGGELRPGIRGVHVDDADGLNARARRLGVDQVG